VKRTVAVFALISLAMILLLPAVLSFNLVSAQSSGYTITKVDHIVEIMFSGHIVVHDSITVSGDLSNGFLIGMPGKYGSSVLKAVAYDSTHVFPMTLGVQLGGQSGFYAAQVNFEGASPTTFDVVFVLSPNLISEDFGFYQLDYPAYPSFTTTAQSCSVSVSPPAQVSTITISKSDGETNSTTYSKSNLPAFTNIPAVAAFSIPTGLLESMDISSLNRQLTIDSAGVLSCSDSYKLTNNSPDTLISFILTMPSQATDVSVRDEFGRNLTSVNLGVVGTTLLYNASLSSSISTGKSTAFTAVYKLPTGNSIYNLNLTLFPAFNYYVDQATFTFTPPEGATFTSPQNSSLDSTSSITKQNSQEVLTINRQGVSYVDSALPSADSVNISYSYNPVWASYRPTYWAFILSVIGCVGVFFWRKLKPSEASVKPEAEKHEAQKATSAKAVASSGGPRINTDVVKNFLEAYDDRKEVSSEMKSLDSKAQKGKLPRRQYKVQRKALEERYDFLTKHINETKEAFRHSSSGYSDLVKQLDNAEVELNEAEENIRTLEAQQESGEISIEQYKSEIGDDQRRKDKAESSINGILLRIREKMS
jgi:hypothetical protein